ncbi:UDP-N-acetylglucosamine 3-dehydrogenase [soil metagenome]
MGNTHARQYSLMEDVELGYHDRLPERAESFQSRFNAHCCENADSLIAWADVLDICLPTDLHVEFALKCIAAGKAVFLEKPIAGNFADAVRVVSAADKAGVPLMIGQVVRYFPDYAAGHRVVKSGRIGTPAAARLRRGGSAPSGQKAWFMDHSRSGGVLLDLAIHDFDWLRWTLGEVKHLYSRSVGATTGVGPDYALTTLTFESGAVAHIEATWMDPSGFRTTFEVAGSEGLIQYDSRDSASLKTLSANATVYESAVLPLDDPYYLELRGFLDSVRDGCEPPVPGYEGLMALSIALAAYESAKSGLVVVPARP